MRGNNLSLFQIVVDTCPWSTHPSAAIKVYGAISVERIWHMADKLASLTEELTSPAVTELTDAEIEAVAGGLFYGAEPTMAFSSI